MRKKIIAGNWKMNKTPSEAVALVETLKPLVANDDVDVVFCVPAIDIIPCMEAVKGSNINIGAENMYFEESGAYTGEISPAMLTDAGVKYGLSVTGVVHPDKILANNAVKTGDVLILTKPLGVGIICTANRVQEASKEAMDKAMKSMTTLNKYSAQCIRSFSVHGCTDVTGFGFLGHLHEMLDGQASCVIYADQVPIFEEALAYADEFLLTAAGQRNRNFAEGRVEFEDVEFAMEEILFDPQTSGGLLFSVAKEEADALMKELVKVTPEAKIVGEIVEKQDKEIIVKKHKYN